VNAAIANWNKKDEVGLSFAAMITPDEAAILPACDRR